MSILFSETLCSAHYHLTLLYFSWMCRSVLALSVLGLEIVVCLFSYLVLTFVLVVCFITCTLYTASWEIGVEGESRIKMER